MPRILASEVVFPPHYYEQAELASRVCAFADHGRLHFDEAKVGRFFSAVRVGGRHLALPLESYETLEGFDARNTAWIECSVGLGERAVSAALKSAGLTASDVRLFASSTVTGIAVPSIEARLMNRLPFSPHCRRLPLFGLGCAAGAAGIARVADYLIAHPRHAALLLCVELCSLTFQPDDDSVANLIACGLFGDGAGCVLMAGDAHPLSDNPGFDVVDTRSVLFPRTERMMGWDVVDTGFRIVLNSGVPELARTALPEGIRDFLAGHGLTPADVTTWIAHPGGPAVIDAIESGLDLKRGKLDASREALARVGNLSSVSVLGLLQQSLTHATHADAATGSGMLFAMGPGFSAELVLLTC